MNQPSIPLTQGPERTAWLQSHGPVAVLNACDLWESKRTPEATHANLHLHALIGRAWLTDNAPLTHVLCSNTAMISGWISDDQHVSVLILPDRHEVEVRAQRCGTESLVRIMVPGEILGAPTKQRYRGIFFSLERGERHANLYNLLDVVAAAVVVALDMADLKLSNKTSPQWAMCSAPSWRERDLPATPALLYPSAVEQRSNAL